MKSEFEKFANCHLAVLRVMIGGAVFCVDSAYASNGDAGIGIFLLMIALAIGLLIYFLPAYVAFKRRHNNRTPILLVNLFLGWMFLGWVAALVWACTDNTEKLNESRNQ